MTMAPQSLYRALIRQGKQVKDYNFRTYAIRRVKAGFRRNRHLQGEEAVAALKDGEEQLKVLQRQAIVSQLYPSPRSVME